MFLCDFVSFYFNLPRIVGLDALEFGSILLSVEDGMRDDVEESRQSGCQVRSYSQAAGAIQMGREQN